MLNFKPIDQYNKEEILDHTLDMLIGIDILCNSATCIVEYSSNVSRFIKLAHKNIENVYDINNTVVDFEKYICPSYSF